MHERVILSITRQTTEIPIKQHLSSPHKVPLRLPLDPLILSTHRLQFYLALDLSAFCLAPALPLISCKK